MPFPCHAVPLIHTCHAAPLPCSDSAVSFVEVRVLAGNIRTASPTVQQIVFFVVCCYHSLQSWVWIVVRRIGMLLITIFVELHVVAEEDECGQLAHRPSLDGRAVPWP